MLDNLKNQNNIKLCLSLSLCDTTGFLPSSFSKLPTTPQPTGHRRLCRPSGHDGRFAVEVLKEQRLFFLHANPPVTVWRFYLILFGSLFFEMFFLFVGCRFLREAFFFNFLCVFLLGWVDDVDVCSGEDNTRNAGRLYN